MAAAGAAAAGGAGGAAGGAGVAGGAGGAGAAGGIGRGGSRPSSDSRPQRSNDRSRRDESEGDESQEEQERNKRKLKLLLLLLLMLFLFAVFTFCVVLVVVFQASQSQASQPAGSGYPTGSGVPPVYWPVYVAAATQYHVNPYLLASIHEQETGFSTATSTKSGFNSNGCCAGPMQFNVKVGTWKAYQYAFRPIREQRSAEHYPSDRRDLPSCRSVPVDSGCVYDDFDAIAAAADLLHKSHADTSLYSAGTRKAVCSYIGSCSEVDSCTGSENQYCEVLPRAREWELKAASTASGPLRERIARIAEGQLKAHVHEGVGNCNPYGPCEEWCAMFSTWVWERAGIHIRAAMSREGLSPYYVPDLETYAKAHGLWRSSPSQGDMIIWGAHVGLVKQVDGGRISEIGGNQSDAVTELVGPPNDLGEGSPLGYLSPPEKGTG